MVKRIFAAIPLADDDCVVTFLFYQSKTVFMKYGCLFLLHLVYFSLHAQKIADTTAIKNLLATEAATYRSGDVKAHAACWQIRPYSRILVSLPDGRSFDVPPQAVVDPPGGKMGNGGAAVMSNFRFHVHNGEAWVSHDEESTDASGKKSYSREIRMLEKVRGKWKLVGQSIHLYVPQTETK